LLNFTALLVRNKSLDMIPWMGKVNRKGMITDQEKQYQGKKSYAK
jgi:hypothetical protein